MVKFSKKNREFEILTKNPSQTKRLGKILAGEFSKTSRKKALVLGLIGDLGGGKTTFLQGFAKGLGIKQKILSPTFVIFRKFKIPALAKASTGKQKSKFKVFYHIDCYRIKKPKEILDLGFKEIVSSPKNIVAIEWAERIQTILPKSTILIKFNFIDKNTREIILKYTG